MKNFWQEQTKKGPLAFLAPMDGYTDSAYRQVVKKINPNVICVTEFFSSDGLINSKFLADSVLPHDKTEKPLIVQIFGKDPEVFVKAAKIIEKYDVAGIDVNMGCPARKVVNSGHGSGLIINRDTAFKIVSELNKHSKLPISVKTRLGFNGAHTLIDFAKGLEEAGASLITVHGRTTAQAYTGNADFAQIYELKKHLSIPVICNGNIANYDDGMQKIHSPSGDVVLDGFMIGRGSFGNPWCFVPGGYEPTLKEILDMMIFHRKKLIEVKQEKKGTLDIRKHLVQYLKGFFGVSKYRKRLVLINSLEELIIIINNIKTEYNIFLDMKVKDIVE